MYQEFQKLLRINYIFFPERQIEMQRNRADCARAKLVVCVRLCCECVRICVYVHVWAEQSGRRHFSGQLLGFSFSCCLHVSLVNLPTLTKWILSRP